MTDQWWNCYNDQWGDELVPEAVSHPAKVAPGLAKRIYDHAFECGWLSDGDMVLDQFGGIAGFGLQAMVHGLQWVGIELEPRFVDLGNQNIALWRKRYGLWPKLGTAVLLQGDSRKLLEVIEAGRAAGVISSPPYAESLQGDNGADSTRKRILAGKYNGLRPDVFFSDGQKSAETFGGGYGVIPGNLGNMRATPDGLDAAISSPPYVNSMDSERNGIDWSRVKKDYPGRVMHDERIEMAERHHTERRYGESAGQLGAMPEGDFDLAASSPPYEGSLDRGVVDPAERVKLAREMGISNAEHISPIDMETIGKRSQPDYGTTDGQLGSMPAGDFSAAGSSPLDAPNKDIMPSEPDNFWEAARLIVAQTYAALRPGGHAIWVVKAFVRNKELVDFPGQWRQLCEACGFVTLHEHHAMLVSESSQLTFGGTSVIKERKSFFRRLSESTAMANKFWEDSVDRPSKARYLRAIDKRLWKEYRQELDEIESGAKEYDETRPPVFPTPSRVRHVAKMSAWTDAGKPLIDTGTRIDYEVIWCMQKG